MFSRLAAKMQAWPFAAHLFPCQHCPLASAPPCKVGAEEAGQGPVPWVQLRAAELFVHRGREGSK